ncbi:hypothetical protein [Bradyrhizobium sp. Bra78]|uniref:hypothetical protein n=1 Tax=Bradyrhizobium sp. Bra78 TaxID=2926010 RepID=UPI0021C5A167|nr:hypothetical protein [Bradyrhizobium sp. Bra78]
MRKLMLAAAMALAIAGGGCSQVRDTWQKIEHVAEAVTRSKVSPEAVVLLASTYDAFEATAKNYVDPRLNKRCDGTNGPICRDPDATIALNKAVRAGRKARNDVKQFLRDHPNELGTQGFYDALKQSVETLRGIFTQYGIKTPLAMTGGVL